MGMQSAQESLGLGLMLYFCQFKILNFILKLVFFMWNQKEQRNMCMSREDTYTVQDCWLDSAPSSSSVHEQSIGIHWDSKQVQVY